MKCVSLPRNFSFFCQLSSEVEWLFFEPSVIKTAVKKILDVGFLRVLGGTSRYLRARLSSKVTNQNTRFTRLTLRIHGSKYWAKFVSSMMRISAKSKAS